MLRLKYPYITLLLFGLLLLAGKASAQRFSNLREKELMLTADTTQIDSLSIIPGSIKMNFSGPAPPENTYQVDTLRSLFIVTRAKNFFANSDSVKIDIKYRVFPYDFDMRWESPYQQSEKGEDILISRALQRSQSDEEDFLDFGDLQKSGAISRGFSLGSKQDASLNSDLNLQLNGALTNNIEIRAAITDNNIPVQPEGNTQQLQDFDKVFIELQKDKHRLIAGDFNVRQRKDRFMRYNRKVQGIKAETNFQPGNSKGNIHVSAGAALSRGKYARNELEGVEGNQGPYKLEGNNNERFIVILSGSESIYLDGEKLQRGQNQDYIINYNTAELSFTPKHTITKDSRIIAEFEYADRNYARALFAAKSSYETKKLKINFNYFNQSDLKNQPFEQDLNDTAKSILSSAGDDPQAALMTGIDSVPFSTDEVLYKMIDSLGYDSILVYSTNPDSARYRVKFSKVGVNQGDYIKKQSAANGNVFQWVQPQGGVSQGEYAPVQILVPPAQQQMISLSAQYDISPKTQIKLSSSSSIADENLFSNLDSGDDQGFAYEMSLRHKEKLGADDSTKWDWISRAGFTMINKNFKPIDRFRKVEFERNWNLKNVSKKNEIQTNVKTGIKNKKRGQVVLQHQFLQRADVFQGQRYLTKGNYEYSGYFAQWNAGFLKSSQQQLKTSFLRHRAKIGKKFKYFTLSLDEDFEDNRFKLATDNLTSRSKAYQTIGAEITTPDTSSFQSTFRIQQRTNRLPLTGEMRDASKAREASVNMKWDIKKHQKINLRLSYRKLEITDSISPAAPEENINTRLDYHASFWDGVIQNQTFYQNGAGLEVEKDFTYLEVSPGQGVYQWEDYNDNNIKEKDEFEVAAFQDRANYIRVYTPTEEYVKVYNNQFTEVLRLTPSRKWKKSEQAVKKFLSKFSNRFTYRIKQKNQLDNFLKAYNPFFKTENDLKLITLNEQMRNIFYFQRNHSEFGANWSYRNVNGKSLLANGSEENSREEHSLNLRWNMSSYFSLLTEASWGNKSRNSEFFNNKDYSIQYRELNPVLSYQPSSSFRIKGLFTYTQKENSTTTTVKAKIADYGLEVRQAAVNKGSFQVKFNYIRIKYPGTENNNLEFEMLEGFKDGDNLKWSVDYQRNILKYLQLNLRYEGRKTPGAKTVHIGRVQIRAFF